MTREEFEAVLIKNGLKKECYISDRGKEVTNYNIINENCYIKGNFSLGFSLHFVGLDDNDVELYAEIIEGNDYTHDNYIIFDVIINYKNITEQQIEEIFSEYTKIKTTLEIIYNISNMTIGVK